MIGEVGDDGEGAVVLEVGVWVDEFGGAREEGGGGGGRVERDEPVAEVGVIGGAHVLGDDGVLAGGAPEDGLVLGEVGVIGEFFAGDEGGEREECLGGGFFLDVILGGGRVVRNGELAIGGGEGGIGRVGRVGGILRSAMGEKRAKWKE